MNEEKPKLNWVTTNYNLAKRYENRSWQDIIVSKRLDGSIDTRDILFEHFDSPDECTHDSSGRKLEEELAEKEVRLFPCLELIGNGTQKIHVSSPSTGGLSSYGVGSVGSGMKLQLTDDFADTILLRNNETLARAIQRRHPDVKHIGTVVDYDTNEGRYHDLKGRLSPYFKIEEINIAFPYPKE